jgi:hypothetical protein
LEGSDLIGPLLGAGAGAGLVALFGGKTEHVLLGAVIGGVAGAVIQNQWRKSKAREARRKQIATQEEVNQAWRTEGNSVPQTPEVAIRPNDSRIVPQRGYYQENDQMQFELAYVTLGDGMNNVSVCRTDELAYFDRSKREFSRVSSDQTVRDSCDLYSGDNENVSALDIPQDVQHGVYVYNSTIALKRNGVVVDEEKKGYLFAIGEEFVDELPEARAVLAQMATDMRLAMAE